MSNVRVRKEGKLQITRVYIRRDPSTCAPEELKEPRAYEDLLIETNARRAGPSRGGITL